MRSKEWLIDAVVGQFGRPHGIAGWLVGWEMAIRPSNRKRNLWVVDLLDVQPTDRVLEVGFGPGIAIRALASRAAEGLVYGIDHSDVMVRQATRRNRAAVKQGRVELRLGSAADLSALDAVFDKVLVVNNFGMWPDPEQGLKDIRGLMRPGGRVAIVSQPRTPGANAETTRRVGEATGDQLRAAGFVRIRTEILDLQPPVACVLAEEEPKFGVTTHIPTPVTVRPQLAVNVSRNLEVKMSDQLLSIGELARRTGVATSALRYYEEIGLLPAPARVSGQRRYPESAVALVGIILLHRDVGFSLAEQKALMASRAVAPDDWRRLARRKLAQLDEQIVKAETAREALEHALRCPHEDIVNCPTFAGVIAARLAGRSLHEAHPH